MEIDELYAELRAGNAGVEEQLFLALTARFRLFAHRIIWERTDAEETAQEALSIVVEKYRNMDFDVSFAGWAHTVLKNCIAEFLRKKVTRGRRFIGFNEKGEIPQSRELDPEVKRQLLDCLQKIAKRNRPYARAITLNYHGYEVGDICKRLTMNRATYYSALSRARTMLNVCLEKGDIR